MFSVAKTYGKKKYRPKLNIHNKLQAINEISEILEEENDDVISSNNLNNIN
jgi:hypothetical protein